MRNLHYWAHLSAFVQEGAAYQQKGRVHTGNLCRKGNALAFPHHIWASSRAFAIYSQWEAISMIPMVWKHSKPCKFRNLEMHGRLTIYRNWSIPLWHSINPHILMRFLSLCDHYENLNPTSSRPISTSALLIFFCALVLVTGANPDILSSPEWLGYNITLAEWITKYRQAKIFESVCVIHPF